MAIINDVFTPTPEEVAEAEDLQRRLTGAVAAGAAGLQMPDGRFVHSSVVLAAAWTLTYGRHGAGAAHSSSPPGTTAAPGA